MISRNERGAGWLDSFPAIRIAVIGDLMLDRYITGSVDRISPEAPVPVVQVGNERSVPGGAANVAANLADLGVKVTLVGLTGADEAHTELVGLLRRLTHIDVAGVVTARDRCTTRKLRILGAHQQILRVDHEDRGAPAEEIEQQLIDAAIEAVDAADLVLLSDYGKGVCGDRLLAAVIGRAAAAGKKILVDPKRRDLTAYRGATVLTPNRHELSLAVGLPCETDDEALRAARRAADMTGADILLTRAEKGMSYFPKDAPPLHLATVAQAVFDVSGAGDTVVAVLASALAAGVPLAEAMRMANHAAGIVVSKLGTATVTRDELAASLLTADRAEPDDGRLLALDAAAAARWAWAQQRLTVGVTNGCFDLIHPGHVSLLRQAAQSCDRLIVALNSDASVRRLKGPTRPIQDEGARAEVMGALKGVAAVVIFEEDTPLRLIETLQPDILIKGADYTVDQVVGADIVQGRGGRVVLADIRQGHSTSRLTGRGDGSAQPDDSDLHRG